MVIKTHERASKTAVYNDHERNFHKWKNNIWIH